MMFLLGMQATFGHAPPNRPRSTKAVRWPALAKVHVSKLPAAPLPRTRFSYFSPLDILELLGKTICGRSVLVFRNLLVRFLYFREINRRARDMIDVVDEDVQCDVGDRLDQFAIGQSCRPCT